MKEKLVLFSFTHFMLSGIQHGIQHGHCTDGMSLWYLEGTDGLSPIAKTYFDWLKNHKTVNVRNGGDQTRLRGILGRFDTEENPYPWGFFREDESLNYCLTCVSIVLPERVFAWEPFKLVEGEEVVPNLLIENKKLDTFDQYLYDLIKSTRHAN